MHNGEVKWVFGFYPKKFWAYPKICKNTNWGTQINLIHSDRKKKSIFKPPNYVLLHIQ